jgi:hypothetical protein
LEIESSVVRLRKSRPPDDEIVDEGGNDVPYEAAAGRVAAPAGRSAFQVPTVPPSSKVPQGISSSSSPRRRRIVPAANPKGTAEAQALPGNESDGKLQSSAAAVAAAAAAALAAGVHGASSNPIIESL